MRVYKNYEIVFKKINIIYIIFMEKKNYILIQSGKGKFLKTKSSS